jgi:phosphonate transport system substrate-binding protein
MSVSCSTRYRAALVVALVLSALIPAAASGDPGYRVGVTAVVLNDQTSFLKKWQAYLEQRLHAPVHFVRRKSYREITELVLQDQLDVAWICGYPFVRHRQRMRLLAVPLFGGEPLYQSYLIVPRDDRATHDITDLQGKIFAYSDPDSNSGYLVPQVHLRKAQIDPRRFFAKAFFTWAHRDVVVAVADQVAQGGAVDGYVWETLRQVEPELTARTRVVRKSEKFGFPPIVSRAYCCESLISTVSLRAQNSCSTASGKPCSLSMGSDFHAR